MAIRQASIVITDDGTACTSAYTVEIKDDGAPAYNTLPNQYSSPIVVTNLISGSVYNMRITRQCCNGASASSTFNLTP